MLRTTIAATLLLAAPAAHAAEPTAQTALTRFCEPLIAGSSAAAVKQAARAEGFADQVVAGQPVMQHGTLLVGISDAPRVCFVQAPAGMTMAQEFALVDSWGKGRPGAVRAPATKGPDGSPVRAWTDPVRKAALLTSQQTAAGGRKVMAFILMPLPKK